MTLIRIGGNLKKKANNTVVLNLYHIYSLEGVFMGEEINTSRLEALRDFIENKKPAPDNYYARFKKIVSFVNKKCPTCGYKNHRIANECDNCGTSI